MVRQKDGYLDSRGSPAFLYSLSVLMVQSLFIPPPKALELMAEDYEKFEAMPLFKSEFSCGHYHGPGPVVYGVEALNPKWWSLAGAEFASHLTSSCGCEHEH